MALTSFYILPALAFVLVSNPETYKVTRGIFGKWVASPDGLACFGGTVLHAIVFLLIVSLLMKLFPPHVVSNYGRQAEFTGVLGRGVGEQDKQGGNLRHVTPLKFGEDY